MAFKSFTVTVTSPGTPQQLSAMLNAKLPQISGVLSGPVSLRGSYISFQADPTNTASKNVYIGGSDLNVGTRTGIGLALAPGAVSPQIFIDGTTELSDFWVDIDAAATTKNLFVLVLG